MLSGMLSVLHLSAGEGVSAAVHLEHKIDGLVQSHLSAARRISAVQCEVRVISGLGFFQLQSTDEHACNLLYRANWSTMHHFQLVKQVQNAVWSLKPPPSAKQVADAANAGADHLQATRWILLRSESTLPHTRE
jgi:hypothetical protein